VNICRRIASYDAIWKIHNKTSARETAKIKGFDI